MSDLPNGWIEIPLREVLIDFQAGFASGKKDLKGGLPHLRMNNIGIDGQLNLDLLRTVPRKLAQFPHYLKKGDILICTTNSAKLVGKCALFNLDGDFAFSNHLTRLRTNEAIRSVFLKHQLWLLWRQGAFENRCKHWVNQSALPKEELLQIPIALPPLREQRRIIEKLEKLLGKVDACQKRLERIQPILKRFRQSVLAAACSGRLTADWREQYRWTESTELRIKRIQKERVDKYEFDCMKALSVGLKKPRRPTNLEPKIRFNDSAEELPDSWLWATFEDIASTDTYSMSSGPFGSALGKKDYVDSGIPVIRGQNIQSGRFVPSSFVFVSNEKAAELKRSTAYPKDIVVVAVGSSGQAAMIPKELPISILSQNCNKITVDGNFALPEYVNSFLQVQISKDRLREKTTDTARPFLSLTNLKTLLLPIPPVEEQQEIVRRVEALFKVADQIEARYNKAKAYVDKLAQSILAKAFRGELVPQDPNDEPTSILLEHIRSQRATSEPKNKKARPLSKKRKQPSLFTVASHK